MPMPGLAGVTPLIVDDNATQRSVLSDYLTDWGMAVSTAPEGRRALTMLQDAARKAEPFAVVLIDRFMPGMDGMELKSRIVADPGLATGVILMTGVGQDRDVGAARTGVLDVVQADTARRSSDQPSGGLGLNAAGPPNADPPPRRRAKTGLGHLLLAEDNLINQKVAVAILTRLRYSVDTVINGAEAVRAVAAQDYDAILMDCQMPELNGYEATAGDPQSGWCAWPHSRSSP